ncbi:MAG: hypothetical protein ACR2GT_11020 [Gaiellaceae bacterium]
MTDEGRAALVERPQEHVLALIASRGAALLLLRVHARVGEPERRRRVRRFLR